MASHTLAELRQAVDALDVKRGAWSRAPFSLGLPELDAWLDGGLACGVLHELYPSRQPLDLAAATGFGLGLSLRAAQDGRSLLWVMDEAAGRDAGDIYGAGLAEFGLDPQRLFIARARNARDALRAAADAARCPGLGAVLLEIRGEAPCLDLTASRRLAIAVAASGTTLVVVRHGTRPGPSAAESRWSVAAAPSVPLEADAPGRPAFEIVLLRHRRGLAPRTWRLEWDRDSLSFAEPALSRPMVPVPVRRPVAQDDAGLRRTG